MAGQKALGVPAGKASEPEIPGELLNLAAAWSDTAVLSLCRYSEEDKDLKPEDFSLTPEEKRLVGIACERFPNIILVLNMGEVLDASWFKDNIRIKAVVHAGQAGMEGGMAIADILCGDKNPSGKLADTITESIMDWPSTKDFLESDDYVNYSEDIYVGYRYFHTLPDMRKKICYPFGFGLSYTTFAIQTKNVQFAEISAEDGGRCTQADLMVKVTNVGERAGKEVVQAYLGAPQGKLGKPSKVLAAFRKTRNLLPGESQLLSLSFILEDFASYDDLGKIRRSAFVLEKGSYRVYVGNSSAVEEALSEEYVLSKDRIVKEYSPRCVPESLRERLCSDGRYEALPTSEIKKDPLADFMPYEKDEMELECIAPRTRFTDYRPLLADPREGGRILLEDVAEGKRSLADFMAQLTDRELAGLLGGQPITGYAVTYGIGNMPEYGVPNIMTTDGPAGIRFLPESEVKTTAWPTASILACSWDPDLLEETARAISMEALENNTFVWLAPAMNIHRNPLCGRNFEYFSEDPLLTGKMGAALIRGMQAMGTGATMKHFCCNNKEANRKHSDSRISERALREIYLKGFEIAVKEAGPWAIMSAYVLLNGVPASCNYDLLTGILREEWGYRGVVMTDWWNFKEHWKEIKAGNDLKMGCGYPDRVIEALEDGLLTRRDLEACAERVLELILKIE